MKQFLLGSLLIIFSGLVFAKPIIIAHRGASGYLPEHTLAAAELAHSWGVDYIEPDVVLTKNKVPIVLHDLKLDTTTNVKEVFPTRKRADGRYYAIDFTLAEIKKLKVWHRADSNTGKLVFPSRVGTETKNDYRVPTLVEFIALVKRLNKNKNKNIGIYPEIKHPEFHLENGADITKIVIDALHSHGYKTVNDKIFVQSFSPKALKRIKFNLKSKLPLIQLVADNSWNEGPYDYSKMMTKEGLKEVSSYATGVGLWLGHLYSSKGIPNRTLVNSVQKQNLKIHAYTIRADALPSFFSKIGSLRESLFEELKLDGAFSDHADQLL